MSDQTAAEEAIADRLFGPETEEYQPDPQPVPEGDEAEVEEVESDEVEADEVEAVDEVEETDPIVEFEWNGQIIEAPTSIKESLMLQKDYTQKTQEVSAQRKELEIRAENLKTVNRQYEFAQVVQAQVNEAQMLEQQITQAQTYLRSNVGQGDDLSPVQIEQIRLAIDEAKEKRDKVINDIVGKNTEFQQAQEQARKELLNKSTEVLRSKVPGWGDTHEGQIRDYALSLGVPEQTFNSIVDPLEKEVLWKALQYDNLQSGKAAAVKKVQSAPTIKSKSRNPMPERTQQKLNLRKKLKSQNKSATDKASLIGEDIASRFNM